MVCKPAQSRLIDADRKNAPRPGRLHSVDEDVYLERVCRNYLDEGVKVSRRQAGSLPCMRRDPVYKYKSQPVWTERAQRRLSLHPFLHAPSIVSYIHSESGHSFLTIIELHTALYPISHISQPRPANMKSTIIAFTLFAVTLGAPMDRRQTGNLQTFTGALGGIAATPVQNSGDAKKPFQVKGDTFVNLSAALARSCDQQFNACANAANGGDKTLSVAQCTSQKGKSMYAD